MSHIHHTLESLALNAWPGLQQIIYDGWVLRFGLGYTGRANSVTALHAGQNFVEDKIDYVEARYAEQHQPALFRITPISMPLSLDQALADRNYRKFNRTLVRSRLLHRLPPNPDALEIHTFDRLSVRWLAPYTELSRTPLEHVPALRQILKNIAPRVHYAVAMDDGEPAACILGVLEHETLGIYNLITRDTSRRRGLASALMTHLLHWAVTQGASRAYLQQLQQNTAAGKLFEQMGFVESYQYYYRINVTP